MIEKHPCIQHSHLIQDLCFPLKRLGIVFFGYTTTTAEGKNICVGSDPDYGRQYLNRSYYNADVHHSFNDVVSKPIYLLWDNVTQTKHQIELYDLAKEFGHSHTLTIIQQHEDINHCYHFSGSNSNNAINQIYFHHLDYLHAFIHYFNDKLNSIAELQEIYDFQFTAIDDKVDTNINIQTLTSIHEFDDLQLNFNNAIAFKRQLHLLTKEELQCLHWLHKGKSAELTSQIVGKSRKTIERHIANAKIKLHCHTAFQLGERIALSGISDWL